MALEDFNLPLDPSSKTNTVIITSLPFSFFNPEVQRLLKHHFESFGRLHTWAPLTGLRRVIVVYWDDTSAELAKELDGIEIGDEGKIYATLRVFRAPPTPLTRPSHDVTHLSPPPLEKNFLISPPGSPPEGWQQIVEDPPNSAPLAEDLLIALEKLQMHRGTGHEEFGRSELIRAEDVDADHLGGGVGIWVEDVEKIEKGEPMEEDHDAPEGEWYNPIAQRAIPPRTMRPPLSA